MNINIENLVDDINLLSIVNNGENIENNIEDDIEYSDVTEHILYMMDNCTIDNQSNPQYLNKIYLNKDTIQNYKECFIDETELCLPDNIIYTIHQCQPINEYVIKYILNNNIIVDYNEIIYSDKIIYAKTLYIYQYIYYYYTSLNKHSIQQRITYLPNNILLWINNLITIIKNSLKLKSIEYETKYKSEYIIIKEDYFKELLYGLKLCVCYIKMIINYCNTYQMNIWELEDKYINKFFRLLNNLCIIIIFMNNTC